MRRTRVKKQKDALNWRQILASMVATEKTRYTLNYIFRTKNMYVGSDGKAIGVVCGEPATSDQFLNPKAFRDVDAVVSAGGIYPNFMQAVPDSAKADATIKLDADKFDAQLKLVAGLAKVPDSLISYSVEKNGELAVGVSVCGQWFPAFTQGHWAFDAKILLPAMQLAKCRSESADVTIELHGRGDGPMVIRWQLSGEFAMAMPQNVY